jgi:hypothetical protein
MPGAVRPMRRNSGVSAAIDRISNRVRARVLESNGRIAWCQPVVIPAR